MRALYSLRTVPLKPALSALNPELVATADALGQRFTAAQPFPHLVIEQFFAPQFAQALLQQFPDFDAGNSIGDDGKPGGKSTFDRIRRLGPAYAELDALVSSSAFLDWLGRCTGIDGLLHDPFYLGAGTHENRDGMSLDPHVDFNLHPSERWHRRLNLIVYLNPQWQPEWGGNIELYADPRHDARPALAQAPLFNRCLIFATSERSWHGFDRIRLPPEQQSLSRRSIALYFYTQQPPPTGAAGRHSTVYVNRQLPPHLHAGHCLSPHDMDTLQALLTQRDEHIRLQYEEIARLLQAQDRGLAGKLMYLLKRAYVRLRRN